MTEADRYQAGRHAILLPFGLGLCCLFAAVGSPGPAIFTGTVYAGVFAFAWIRRWRQGYWWSKGER